MSECLDVVLEVDAGSISSDEFDTCSGLQLLEYVYMNGVKMGEIKIWGYILNRVNVFDAPALYIKFIIFIANGTNPNAKTMGICQYLLI